MKNQKGFTLIELLVVIAIIGILSSVVLASLNTARAKGGDAAIKSQLAAIRPQAEIVYDNNGNYGTVLAKTSQAGCTGAASTSLFGTTTVSQQIAGAYNASGYLACEAYAASGNATAWAAAASLKSDNTQAWCVDSAGTSKVHTGLTGNTAPTAAITNGLCN
jgi:type IV pilus assembly protein PilA